MSLLLFYLLVFLLPTQLGRHFFFPFTLIMGVRSDYLAPTIYFTDLITSALIILWVWRIRRVWRPPNFAVTGIILYLLISSLFIAENSETAYYKLARLMEMFLLGFSIHWIKPKLKTTLLVLLISATLTSILALVQFKLQHTVGGLLWWLGERSFSAGTPGIAAVSLGGRLTLRPYSTFPHPNALGGFLAVVLTLSLSLFRNARPVKISKILGLICIFIILSALILTFSRLSWLVAILGLLITLTKKEVLFKKWIIKNKKTAIYLGVLVVFLSISLPLAVPIESESYQERVRMTRSALSVWMQNPFLGVGLNNSIIQMSALNTYDRTFFHFQPVHHVPLLLLTETGIMGIIFFIILIKKANPLRFTHPLLLIALFQMGLISLFDHYLFTTQQGLLMLTLITSLAFLRKFP